MDSDFCDIMNGRISEEVQKRTFLQECAGTSFCIERQLLDKSCGLVFHFYIHLLIITAAIHAAKKTGRRRKGDIRLIPAWTGKH